MENWREYFKKMEIEIYRCSEYKEIFCPYMISSDTLKKNPSGHPCNRSIKECRIWREKNFPTIKDMVERKDKIERHNLKNLEKITLNVIVRKNTKTL